MGSQKKETSDGKNGSGPGIIRERRRERYRKKG